MRDESVYLKHIRDAIARIKQYELFALWPLSLPRRKPKSPDDGLSRRLARRQIALQPGCDGPEPRHKPFLGPRFGRQGVSSSLRSHAIPRFPPAPYAVAAGPRRRRE